MGFAMNKDLAWIQKCIKLINYYPEDVFEDEDRWERLDRIEREASQGRHTNTQTVLGVSYENIFNIAKKAFDAHDNQNSFLYAELITLIIFSSIFILLGFIWAILFIGFESINKTRYIAEEMVSKHAYFFHHKSQLTWSSFGCICFSLVCFCVMIALLINNCTSIFQENKCLKILQEYKKIHTTANIIKKFENTLQAVAIDNEKIPKEIANMIVTFLGPVNNKDNILESDDDPERIFNNSL